MNFCEDKFKSLLLKLAHNYFKCSLLLCFGHLFSLFKSIKITLIVCVKVIPEFFGGPEPTYSANWSPSSMLLPGMFVTSQWKNSPYDGFALLGESGSGFALEKKFQYNLFVYVMIGKFGVKTFYPFIFAQETNFSCDLSCPKTFCLWL